MRTRSEETQNDCGDKLLKITLFHQIGSAVRWTIVPSFSDLMCWSLTSGSEREVVAQGDALRTETKRNRLHGLPGLSPMARPGDYMPVPSKCVTCVLFASSIKGKKVGLHGDTSENGTEHRKLSFVSKSVNTPCEKDGRDGKAGLQSRTCSLPGIEQGRQRTFRSHTKDQGFFLTLTVPCRSSTLALLSCAVAYSRSLTSNVFRISRACREMHTALIIHKHGAACQVATFWSGSFKSQSLRLPSCSCREYSNLGHQMILEVLVQQDALPEFSRAGVVMDGKSSILCVAYQELQALASTWQVGHQTETRIFDKRPPESESMQHMIMDLFQQI
jgi:hypothetical protein